MQQSYDVVVIGGGVVGSAIARELSRYMLRVAVLEKESDVCTQTSGRNTGMLHAGFLYKTGTLKAICAVEGNQEFDAVAQELDVPFKRTGKLIVGFTDEHRQRLEAFLARQPASIGVLTVPRSAAPAIAERLARSGVKGIWNFTNIELTVSVPGVVIEDVHFADSLLALNYMISEAP